MNRNVFRTLVIVLLLCAAITCAAAAAVVLPERKLSGVPLYVGLLSKAAPSAGPETSLSDVPLYSQPTDETCGETAFLMAWNYIHPDKTLEIADVISTATHKGWYVPVDPTGVYTSPAHMSDMANYYASQNGMQNAEAGHLTNAQQALVFLFSQIVAGQPVIVDISTIVGDTTSSAHFVVVTGVSLTDADVYYNDSFGYISPGKRQADQERTDWAIFWNSWSNNGDDHGKGNGWYMVVK